MLQETEILNIQQFRESRSHEVYHLVQNVHLEKEITLVCFCDYTNEESSQVNHSSTQPAERTRGTLLLQWEESLFELLKWQFRIKE